MSEKDDIGGEPTAPSSAPQEIASPYSPTIGGLLQSCGPPPSKMFIIDTDDDEMEADSAQIEPQNDFSDCDARSHEDFDEEACDNCKNMELTARKAYESLTSYKKQIDKFTSFEKENQQLRNIYSENATYLEELLKTQKELESKNTQMEAELQYEKRQAESHEAQIKKAYSMLQENQAHLAAANEWRVKYDASQETLKQVHEMRKTYDEKMSDTLKVAQALQTQLGRAERKVEKLTDETNGVRARLKYISDYMPLLLSAVDLLLTRFPQEPEIRQRYTRLTEPDVRVVLMGKRITSKILEHAIAQGSTTWIQDVDNPESAEIEDSLDQDLRLSESEDDALETSFDTKSGFSQKLPARASQPARTLQGTKIERKSPKKLFSKSNDAIESEDDAPETSFNTKSGFSQKLPARALQPGRTLEGTKIERKSPKKLFSNADIILPNTSTVKLSVSNDAVETDETPSTIHERKTEIVRRQTGLPEAVKNNLIIRPRSIMTLHSPTTSRAIKRNTTFLKAQPLGTPISSKPKSETTRTSVAGLESSASSDDDELFDTISPSKISTNENVKNISSLEHAEGDPTDVHGVTSTIHGRKTRTVREQQQKMGNISDRIAKLKEDPTFAKATVETKEMPKDDKNNFTILPRIRRSATMAMNAPKSRKGASVSFESPPLDTQIVNKPENEGATGSFEGMASQVNDVSQQDNLDQDLRLSESEDEDIPDMPSGTKRVSFFVKPVEQRSPEKLSAPQDINTPKSPSEALSTEESNSTKTPETIKTTRERKARTPSGQPQITRNVSKRVVKPEEDAKATNQTKEVPKDVKQNVVTTSRPTRALRATTIATTTKTPRLVRKRNAACIDAQPLDAPITNKPKYMNTPESIASQIEDMFKKVADGVPLKKASGALAVDLDEAAKILDPPAIATLFIQVLNVTEVGNLWLSLTKSLNAYRKSNEANDLNDAFRHTTAKVELEFIQVINQMDLDGELFNETFNRVCTLIFCQKQPTITQFCRNVRVAFLLLHFNQVLSNEEKLIRSRKLVEFMLYERSADLALSSLCFLCFNEGHKLLDWLRGDDIDAVQRQICSLLANRSNKTQDYLDILSFIFPNVILSPLDTEVFLQSWINGLKALDEEIANKPTAFKLVDGKFEVDNNILNKIEQLIISLPSNTHTLQTLGIPDNLVKDSFAMIEQGIVGATNSTDGGLFSDSTKYNVEVDSKKLNLLCVHLLLAIDIIGEYVRSKTTPEIRRLMETLKHVDEKVPLLMSRCSQSKMSSECIALTKDILLNWQQSTKMLTEYQYME